jgi:hypothetical protein
MTGSDGTRRSSISADHSLTSLNCRRGGRIPLSAFNEQRRTAEVQAQAQEEQVAAVTADTAPMMTIRSSRPRNVAGCLAMTHLDERAEGN